MGQPYVNMFSSLELSDPPLCLFKASSEVSGNLGQLEISSGAHLEQPHSRACVSLQDVTHRKRKIRHHFTLSSGLFRTKHILIAAQEGNLRCTIAHPGRIYPPCRLQGWARAQPGKPHVGDSAEGWISSWKLKFGLLDHMASAMNRLVPVLKLLSTLNASVPFKVKNVTPERLKSYTAE